MIPERHEIKEALINLLDRKGSQSPSTVYKALSEQLGLNADDLAKKTNTNESFFEKEVRWAKKDLVDSGVIKNPHQSGRGIWELSVKPEDKLTPILAHSFEEIELELSRVTTTQTPPIGQKKPERVSSSTEMYARDVRVVAYVLKEAEGHCEACLKSSPFIKADGAPYLEVHHLRHLADGGSDTVQNAIAVCPNCHRELHHGRNKIALRDLVYSRVSRIVRE
ncbi:HNH endonuclease signature motif containing protein [Pseudomonas sp. MS19]|uniref:HNH endonuclease n=1 Tax=Pseudomonas sp. MS19 TaxID=2579939 RepID=UPI001562AFF7|nr:HNH endonuclease signature motif containing protein [Pseudomonas sp. MS19]NRH26972.1 hypothetical protein [Pseudomonas sp. MS19]